MIKIEFLFVSSWSSGCMAYPYRHIVLYIIVDMLIYVRVYILVSNDWMIMVTEYLIVTEFYLTSSIIDLIVSKLNIPGTTLVGFS